MWWIFTYIKHICILVIATDTLIVNYFINIRDFMIKICLNTLQLLNCISLSIGERRVYFGMQ